MHRVRESVVVRQACGVISARLEVDPETAANILVLIAELYTNGYGYDSAA